MKSTTSIKLIAGAIAVVVCSLVYSGLRSNRGASSPEERSSDKSASDVAATHVLDDSEPDSERTSTKTGRIEEPRRGAIATAEGLVDLDAAEIQRQVQEIEQQTGLRMRGPDRYSAKALTGGQRRLAEAKQRADRANFAEAVSSANPTVIALLDEMRKLESKRASTLNSKTSPNGKNIIVKLLMESATPEELDRIKMFERTAIDANSAQPEIGSAISYFAGEYARLNGGDRVLAFNVPSDPEKRVAVRSIGLESRDQVRLEGGEWKGITGPEIAVESLTHTEFSENYSHLVKVTEDEIVGDS